MAMLKESATDEQIGELVKSMRICSQCSTCADCMFKSMRNEYEQEFGRPNYTCHSALLDEASELICSFYPEPKKTRIWKKKKEVSEDAEG